MLLLAAIVMLITGAIMVWLALWGDRWNRRVKPLLMDAARWKTSDIAIENLPPGYWQVTTALPIDHSKPDVSIMYIPEPDVERELEG